MKNKKITGSIGGVPAEVCNEKDTLKSPLPENRTMKTASMSAIFITTFFYLCCGCFRYAAFGDKTPGNLLSGIGFYEPFWYTVSQ
ncbi:unnamed protein product [Camellia sinensis]